MEVDLIDGFTLKPDDHGRQLSPWYIDNNIQRINEGTCAVEQFAPTATHAAWLRKIADEIGWADNVIFQVGNESGVCDPSTTRDWEEGIINIVREQLRRHGSYPDHLFSTNSERPPIEGLPSVDYVNHHSTTTSNIATDIRAHKPTGVNEYPTIVPDAYTRELWSAFTKGTYLDFWPEEQTSNQRARSLERMAIFSGFVAGTNFGAWRDDPLAPNLVGKTGQEYVGFLANGGRLSVNLGSTPATFQYRWVDPRSGVIGASGAITGSGSQSFAAPSADMWVLHIRRGSASVWEDDDFDSLRRGSLNYQNGWVTAPGRASAQVVPDPRGGQMLQIHAPPGTQIGMGKNVVAQTHGSQRLEFDVQVSPGAQDPSMAKLEVQTTTDPRHPLDNKLFEIYFGISMRVDYPSGLNVPFLPTTELGHWYHIRCDMNLDNRLLDVWVDAPDGCPGTKCTLVPSRPWAWGALTRGRMAAVTCSSTT